MFYQRAIFSVNIQSLHPHFCLQTQAEWGARMRRYTGLQQAITCLNFRKESTFIQRNQYFISLFGPWHLWSIWNFSNHMYARTTCLAFHLNKNWATTYLLRIHLGATVTWSISHAFVCTRTHSHNQCTALQEEIHKFTASKYHPPWYHTSIIQRRLMLLYLHRGGLFYIMQIVDSNLRASRRKQTTAVDAGFSKARRNKKDLMSAQICSESYSSDFSNTQSSFLGFSTDPGGQ